jgi:hypothetical protein
LPGDFIPGSGGGEGAGLAYGPESGCTDADPSVFRGVSDGLSDEIRHSAATFDAPFRGFC